MMRWTIKLIPMLFLAAGWILAASLAMAEDAAKDGSIQLTATGAKIVGGTAQLEGDDKKNIGYWTDPADCLEWKVKVGNPGKFVVKLEYALDGGSDNSEIALVAGEKRVEAKLAATGGWGDYKTVKIGELALDKAGEVTISLKPLRKTGEAMMNFREVVLMTASQAEKENLPAAAPASSGVTGLSGLEQAKDGVIKLTATNAKIVGSTAHLEGDNPQNIGYWTDPKDYLTWKVKMEKPGKFAVDLEYALDSGSDNSEISISAGTQSLKTKLAATGGWGDYKTSKIGELTLDKAGEAVIEIKPVNKTGEGVMNFRGVALNPAK